MLCSHGIETTSIRRRLYVSDKDHGRPVKVTLNGCAKCTETLIKNAVLWFAKERRKRSLSVRAFDELPLTVYGSYTVDVEGKASRMIEPCEHATAFVVVSYTDDELGNRAPEKVAAQNATTILPSAPNALRSIPAVRVAYTGEDGRKVVIRPGSKPKTGRHWHYNRPGYTGRLYADGFLRR